MNILVNIIEWLILAPLLFTAAYLFFFALLGLGKKRKRKASTDLSQPTIALFVPAYKEDSVIVDTAKQLLQLDYPQEKWELIIIADSFQKETLDKLQELPLRLMEVSFEKSTKAKALNEAMRRLERGFEIAVILDADNVADSGMLKEIVEAWTPSTQVIQCHRTAKNTETATALLDAISEEVANHIFCKGHRAIGLSSRLIGSGMAFDYALFKEMMAGIDAVGGFDKELELKLLQRGIAIEYLPQTKVYDEKVSKAETLQKQRLRWIAAQFHYLRAYFLPALGDFVRKGNIDFLDKALQMMLAPRLFLIALSFLGMCTSWLLGIPVQQYLWTATFAMVFLAYLLGTPRKFFTWKSLQALLSLPKTIFMMALGMRKIGSANKKFIHTPHGNVSSQQTEMR